MPNIDLHSGHKQAISFVIKSLLLLFFCYLDFDVKMGSISSEYDFIVVGGESMLLEIRVGI
jgi:hypothetical protein